MVAITLRVNLRGEKMTRRYGGESLLEHLRIRGVGNQKTMAGEMGFSESNMSGSMCGLIDFPGG